MDADKKGYSKPPSFILSWGYFAKKLVLSNLDIEDDWLDEELSEDELEL